MTRDQAVQFASKYGNPQDPSYDAQYYGDVFELSFTHPILIRWNWAAFFFNFLWMAYRRMYFYAFLVIWIQFFLLKDVFKNVYHYAISLNQVSPISGSIISLVIWAICVSLFTCVFYGLFGNTLYIHHMKRKVSKGRFLSGTSFLGAFLFFLLFKATGMASVPFIQPFEKIFRLNLNTKSDKQEVNISIHDGKTKIEVKEKHETLPSPSPKAEAVPAQPKSPDSSNPKSDMKDDSQVPDMQVT